MTDSTPLSQPPPKLLDQVRDRLRLKHYSIRTEAQYVHWIRRFILFHDKRHPASMGAAEVEAFLTDLAVEGRVLVNGHPAKPGRDVRPGDRLTLLPAESERGTAPGP